MATMDRDLDALERALQAVKTRSANALLNEQSYLARIAQLEEPTRQPPTTTSRGSKTASRA
jgi:hypothetical protein